MRSILVVLAVASIPAPSIARPAVSVLTMQWLDGENLHLANQEGAINRHREVAIRVELRAQRVAVVVERGSAREHHLYPSFTTADDVQWTTTWRGTWTRRGGSLRLVLARDARRCARTKTTSGAAAETLACRPVSKQLELACSSTQVEVEAADASGTTRHTAWRCLPVGTSELGDTPTPWTFGIRACLQTSGGRRGLGYQPCEPRAP